MTRAASGRLNPFLRKFEASPPDRVGGPLVLGAPIATKGKGRSGHEHPLGIRTAPSCKGGCSTAPDLEKGSGLNRVWERSRPLRPCDKQG